MTVVTNIPDFRVTLDGRDLTSKLRPRLVSLRLTDKRAGEADQLDIVLDDSDGRLALPKEGATLRVALGWKQGSDVAASLVDKGSFIVDEVEHSGPPDQISIRARSADFTSEIRTRREKSWHDSTIGAIVDEIARRNRLQPACAPALASRPVKALAQSRESDMALLRRLGREYDAVATVKAGKLVFAPVGAGVTAAGKPIPPLVIARRDGDRHSYTVQKREEAEGATAEWHDRKAGKKKKVTIGKDAKAKRLSRVYASEGAATRAAQAEHGRIKRAPIKFDVALALGRADIYPERPCRVRGFKPVVDETAWLVVEVAHELGQRGFTTSLQLEAKT